MPEKFVDFTELPKDIVNNVLGNYLDLRTLAITQRLSKNMSTTFKAPFEKQKPEKFMALVQTSQHDRVKNIVAHEPELMFAEMDGESPLAFAFKVYDKFMWEIFLQAVYNNQDQKLLDRFSEARTSCKNHIDLEPLYDAYNTLSYDQQMWRVLRTDKEHRKAEFLKLGLAQAKYLPWHLIKTICDPRNQWELTSQFDIKPPAQCDVLAFYAGKIIVREVFDINKLGKEFVLLSIGGSPNAMGADKIFDCLQNATIQYDLLMLDHLFNLRKKAFAALKATPLQLPLDHQQRKRKI